MLLRNLLLHALVIASSVSYSVSEIKDTNIFHDYRPMILFERFGFEDNGHVAISVKDVKCKPNHRHHDTKSQLKPSSMGFFLVKDQLFPLILNESSYDKNFCVLSSQHSLLIFQFDNLSPDSTYNSSVVVKEPDEYSLLFGNCQPEFEVSMFVHTEMYNMQDGVKDFLPSGQTLLPKLYFILFFVYTSFFATWISVCVKQSPNVDKIHIIMGILLLFKALKVICASEDKLYVQKTGTPHGWDIPFYIFGFFKGIMLFTVITLIGTGWSFLKPYLQDREKKVLMIVIPLQVLENIAYVVIDETGPATKDWMAWNQMFLLIDIMCCGAVFVPIIWSIKSLREASKMDGKAAKNLEKLTLFKKFYIVVVSYLYFTRIVVLGIGAVTRYRHEWAMTAAMEGASLAFYVFIFYNFQPIHKNPYLMIGEEDEMVASQILEEDGIDAFEI